MGIRQQWPTRHRFIIQIGNRQSQNPTTFSHAAKTLLLQCCHQVDLVWFCARSHDHHAGSSVRHGFKLEGLAWHWLNKLRSDRWFSQCRQSWLAVSCREFEALWSGIGFLWTRFHIRNFETDTRLKLVCWVHRLIQPGLLLGKQQQRSIISGWVNQTFLLSTQSWIPNSIGRQYRVGQLWFRARTYSNKLTGRYKLR